MQKRKLKTWQEVLLALSIVVPLMLLLFWPMLSSEVRPWERGRPVPVEPPDESRRFRSDLGASIVVPPNWETREMALTTTLMLHPRQSFPRRHRAGIYVTRQPRRTGRDEHTVVTADVLETTLAGFAARRTVSRRAGTFDDPPLTTWTYLVVRGDEVFEVAYFLADDPDEIPPMVRRYLETIEFPGD